MRSSCAFRVDIAVRSSFQPSLRGYWLRRSVALIEMIVLEQKISLSLG